VQAFEIELKRKPPVPVGVCLILDYIAETLQQKQKWRNIKKPSSFHICYKFKQLRDPQAHLSVLLGVILHLWNLQLSLSGPLMVLGNTYQSKLLEVI
ncbi:hypothetical protein S245_070367, partial [Arachis hypogaea]